jgi:hypothetical protein
MICEKTEAELEQLHREAVECCQFLVTTLMNDGCPKDIARDCLARFATLYKNLGLDLERMKRLIR